MPRIKLNFQLSTAESVAALFELIQERDRLLAERAWRDISTAPQEEDARILAWDPYYKRVREAVCKHQWDWNSDDGESYTVEWWWANDSCSCCYSVPLRQPTLWQPLPEGPVDARSEDTPDTDQSGEAQPGGVDGAVQADQESDQS